MHDAVRSVPAFPAPRWVLAVIAVALLVRGAHFVQLSNHDPFFLCPAVDAAFHDAWARQLLGETPRGSPPHIAVGEAFYKPPLYPYLLAVAYKLFSSSPAAASAVQLLLGAGTCTLIALLAGSLFEARTGLVAGLLAAVYGPLIQVEGRLLSTGLEVMLSALLMLLLHHAAAMPPGRRWLAAGLVTSLATIARPPLLVPSLLLAAWALAQLRSRADASVAVRAAIVYLVGVATFIAPVAGRNWLVGHEIVLVSANDGINLFIGNRRGSDGYSAVPTGARWQELQQEAHNVGARKPGAASRYWRGRALAEIAATPLRELAELYLRKVTAFLGEWEIRNNPSYQFSRKFSVALLPSRVCFGLIGPLALVGALVGWRSRREVIPLTIFPTGCLLAVLPFFVCDRFRLPALPALIVLASFALTWFTEQVAERRFRGLIAPVVALVAASLFVQADLSGARAKDTGALDYVDLGNAYFGSTQRNDALAAYEGAARRDPRDPDAHFGVALLAETRGDPVRAEAEYRAAAALAPTSYDAWNNLGVVVMKRGRLEEASRCLRRATEIVPDAARAWVNLGLCQAGLRDREGALASARRACDLDPANLQAWLLLSDLLVGDQATVAEAEQAALRAAAIDPNWPGVAVALSRVHLAGGKPAEAIAVLAKALERTPTSRDLALQLARAHEQAGDRGTALGLYEQLATSSRGTRYEALARQGMTRCRQ